MLLAYVTVLPYKAILFPYRDKGAKALSSSATPSQANFATASKRFTGAEKFFENILKNNLRAND
ncbi:hypothetical protein [Undibacterium terreum]|uniref:Uncharacterized protein n=1 Tax=Undibacterium terreum TaxID=1224302 RepID=A0A916UBH2_9BURK|nr:hypothetical protein [Undibacterium terreum]GGC66449.1 hypothetical protein GCM10011396_11910 [Undibacterium terreum]